MFWVVLNPIFFLNQFGFYELVWYSLGTTGHQMTSYDLDSQVLESFVQVIESAHIGGVQQPCKLTATLAK